MLSPILTAPHSTATVRDIDITTTGVLPTRSTPPPAWGIDWTAPLLTWVQITDDGDYLYTPDQRHATPAGSKDITARINQHIATDITALRHARGLG